MKKLITLCGFLVLGSIACGDADVVKAEAINNQTTDTSGYTITIPSDVDIDKDSGKGSFAVTGKMDAQTKLDVTVNSQNGYKLKCGSKSIDYTLDKQSFHVDNIKSSDVKSFNENFDATLSYTDMNFSGSYKDKLTFNIESNVYIYKLDLNSILDGVNNYSVHDYGTADIYINGKKVADDVSDWGGTVHYGDTYEIKDIKGTTGHHYSGASDGENNLNNFPLKGKIGIDTKHVENSKGILYSSIFLKFDTNKLTVNYHADGAQTWYHFDDVTYDVSGKDIATSETLLFGSKYSEKAGLGDVSRLTKKGYTAKSRIWSVGKNGNKEIRDDKGLSKVEDIANYCGVLDEFKKNDTTIDLYPIWTANTYTLTVNPNGGLINGDGSSKVLDTKLCFDTGNCWDINYLKPTRKGFEFLGWYDAPENGNIVYDSNGKCINNGNYWKDSSYVNPNNLTVYAQWKKMSYSAGTVLNIEGSDYIVMSRTDDDKYLVIRKDSIGDRAFQSSTRIDGQNRNTYEDSEIDNYLENDWYNSLSTSMKVAIDPTDIKQSSYSNFNDFNSKQETGYNGQIYNIIKRHVFLPSVNEIENVVDLNKSFSIYGFVGHNKNIWTRDSIQNSNEKIEAFYGNYRVSGAATYKSNAKAGVRPTFVIDLSKVDYTVTGHVSYK